MPRIIEDKTPQPVRTPPKASSVVGGYDGGWDLSKVDDDFLIAELIRRGYRNILPELPKPAPPITPTATKAKLPVPLRRK